MPLVSVVMPIYNVEQYLDKCIQSVRNQTLSDIEIICVNDGSTDSSLDIINKHASEDSRIVIISKSNSGYGNSMNVGFEKAKGEYIGVVETDDYILPNMYEVLYKLAKDNNLDFVKSDHYKFTEGVNGKEDKVYYSLTSDNKYYNKVINPQEDLGTFNLIMMTWSGIYKKSFLVEHNIKHNETPGASYQDNGFWFQVFSQANRAYFINQAFYMLRRDNPNSSVNSRDKVYAMSTEYDFIERFLKKVPGRFEKYKTVYYHHRCVAYHFTLKRIAPKFRYEFILKFSADFKEPLEYGWLNETGFSPLIWKYTKMIVNDPEYFYCWKYYSVRYEDSLPIETRLRYYSLQKDTLEKEIKSLRNSKSYKIGRGVTALPRVLIDAKKVFKTGGVKQLNKAISEHIWGEIQSKKKILFVASDNSSSSGAFLSMCVLADILQTEYNYEAIVVVPKEGTGIQILKEKCIRYFLIKSYDWVVPITDSLSKEYCKIKSGEDRYTHNAAVQIAKLILKERIDLVHINTSYAYVGALAAKYSNRPFIWHLREFLEEDQGRKIWCRDKALSLIGESDKIIAISKAIYQKYSLDFGENLIQIYNGVDNSKFTPNERSILTTHKHTFIFVGGLSERKGCFFLISALEQYVLRGHNDFRIFFVGRGTAKFEHRLNNSILRDYSKYVGYQKDTEKYYKLADIAFTCSDAEAFGRITVEAMMCGCLVIGVNAGCTPEIITSNETGFLYEKGNIDDFISKLVFACNNICLSQECAHNGQILATNSFNAKINAKKIEAEYSTILNNRHYSKSSRIINACKLMPIRMRAKLYFVINDYKSKKQKESGYTIDVNKLKQLDEFSVEYRKALASAKSDSKVSFELALYFRDEKNDLDKYEEWLEISSHLGNTKAVIQLIDYLSRGSYEKQKQAYNLAKLYAEKNNGGAQYRLGLFYLNGIGVDADDSLAYDWIKKSADNGYEKAEIAYFKYISERELYDADVLHSVEKIAAKGNSQALYYLAQYYRKINVCNLQYVTYLDLSSSRGNSKAIIEYTHYLLKGSYEDQSKAFSLCKSIEKNNLSAQFLIGQMYYKGLGVEQDLEKAHEYIHRASLAGYAKAIDFEKNMG